MVQIPPLVEQVLSETRALDGFKELLGNDGVRIDVGAVERCHQSVAIQEFFHELSGRELFCLVLYCLSAALDILSETLHRIACRQTKNSDQAKLCC